MSNITVFIKGNEIGDPSSNPGQILLGTNALGKGMNPSVLPPPPSSR